MLSDKNQIYIFLILFLVILYFFQNNEEFTKQNINSSQINDNILNNNTQIALIDEKNIDKFLSIGGKFLYTDSDYYVWTTNHLVNSIHLSSDVFKITSTYPNTVPGNDALLPAQQEDPEVISKILRKVRLSVNDHICVYCEIDKSITRSFYVINILQSYGFKNVYYLNTEYKNLDSKYLTKDYPKWRPVVEDYYYDNSKNLQAQEVAELNKLGKITIVDIRIPEQFNGIEKRFKINGHIPNSINIPWKQFFVPIKTSPLVVSNKLIDISQINKILSDNKITQNSNIVITCNTGVEISILSFILKNLLSWNNYLLFKGSWNAYQYLYQLEPKQFPIIKGD